MSATGQELIHAVAVAIAVDADGPLAGALILGQSGSGKSSLALSIIEGCPHHRSALVADDAVIVEAVGDRLLARAPERIAGLLEIRGFGPSKVRAVPTCSLFLAINLGDECERTPAPLAYRAGGSGPAIPLYPFLWKGVEASAPNRLRRMVASILGGQSAQRAQDMRSAQPD